MLPCHKSKATSERRLLAAAETSNAPDHCASQVLNYSINLNHHILENEEFFFFFFLLFVFNCDRFAGKDLFYITRWDSAAQQLHLCVGCHADYL
jgi:hypothetical protein